MLDKAHGGRRCAQVSASAELELALSHGVLEDRSPRDRSRWLRCTDAEVASTTSSAAFFAATVWMSDG